MICASCGTQNDAGRKFCGECGAYVDTYRQHAFRPEHSATTRPLDQALPAGEPRRGP